MSPHGSTTNRKHSRFDAQISVRFRTTDLATIARFLVSKGEFFMNRSKLVQACMDLAVRFVVSQGGKHVSSTEEATDLLAACGVDSNRMFHRTQFALMRNLQEEGEREPDSEPTTPVEEVEVPHKPKEFHELSPEQQQWALDAGWQPDKGRMEEIEERDARMRETRNMSLEQLKKSGTLVEPENDKQN